MPTYSFLRPTDHVQAFTLDFPNDGQASAFANTQGLDWERLTGQETYPDDLLLVVPGDALITYPPPVLPPKTFAVKNRGEIKNLRARRQNGQSITYPVLIEGRDGSTLTIPNQAALDQILGATTPDNAQAVALAQAKAKG